MKDCMRMQTLIARGSLIAQDAPGKPRRHERPQRVAQNAETAPVDVRADLFPPSSGPGVWLFA